MPGALGIIEPGALAHLLVVDGNSLEDLSLVQNQGAHLSHVMKGGQPHTNRLRQICDE
jgi:imidazolonepropionase-like amidohydrolase